MAIFVNPSWKKNHLCQVHSREMKTQHIKFEILNDRLKLYFVLNIILMAYGSFCDLIGELFQFQDTNRLQSDFIYVAMKAKKNIFKLYFSGYDIF